MLLLYISSDANLPMALKTESAFVLPSYSIILISTCMITGIIKWTLLNFQYCKFSKIKFKGTLKWKLSSVIHLRGVWIDFFPTFGLFFFFLGTFSALKKSF